MPSLEIACFHPSSALTASSNGASRIELCRSQADGGLTPALSIFKDLKKSISIPIYVMIRPHSDSFIYSPAELSEMEENIKDFRDAGADGFVFGVLDERGLVDGEVCRRLVDRAEGKACTFHRAFDEVPLDSMGGQLEVLVECRFKAVLTSGGAKSAVEGKDVLRDLVEKAGGRIDVIVGGGVRAENVEELKGTGARWFHSSAVVDGGEEASGEEVTALREAVGR